MQATLSPTLITNLQKPSTNLHDVKESKTCLYLIPTPIGNLGDITLRSLETLKTVNTILAEDTRKSGILLKHYDISKPLQSFHIFNEHQTLSGLIQRMKDGEVMA